MADNPISSELGDVWRDHVLKHVVAHLEANRDAIIDDFVAANADKIDRERVEQSGLLDFDVSITLHRDRKQSFGLGLNFFKANMIR